MKKCPISFSGINREQIAVLDCIGAQCAAYHELVGNIQTTDENGITTVSHLTKNRWTCAMFTRGVWHDVDERK